MQEYCRSDRQSGDAQVAGLSRSSLLRHLMRMDFLSPRKKPKSSRASDAFASDCACSGAKAKNQRRRLDEERYAVFNQSADLSTYPRKISVRTTRATAPRCCVLCNAGIYNYARQRESDHVSSIQRPLARRVATIGAAYRHWCQALKIMGYESEYAVRKPENVRDNQSVGSCI
jgi:hypothetical protein